MGVVSCGPELPEGRPGGRSTVLHDRRRPGRREVSPELIPLLRGQVHAPAELLDPVPEAAPLAALALRDDLGPVKGIVHALGFACFGWAALWALILH